MSIHNTSNPELCYCIFCRRRLLQRHFKTREPTDAQDKDFIVMHTKRAMYILGPRSLLTGERRVVAQL